MHLSARLATAATLMASASAIEAVRADDTVTFYEWCTASPGTCDLFDAAANAAATIDDTDLRVEALANIARVMAQVGRSQDGQVMLVDALEILRGHQPDPGRVGPMESAIACAQVALGDADAAADTISSLSSRFEAARDPIERIIAAEVLARVQPDLVTSNDVIGAISQLDETMLTGSLPNILLEILVKMGRYDEAALLVERMPQGPWERPLAEWQGGGTEQLPDPRPEAWAIIGVAQAQAGDLGGARATLEKITGSDEEEISKRRSEVLGEIAAYLANDDQLAEARDIGEALGERHLAWSVAQIAIAAAEARTGAFERALATSESLSPGPLRGLALGRIAAVQSTASGEDWRSTLDAALAHLVEHESKGFYYERWQIGVAFARAGDGATAHDVLTEVAIDRMSAPTAFGALMLAIEALHPANPIFQTAPQTSFDRCWSVDAW